MSATRNDVTGDVIASKVRRAGDMSAYQSGWDRIFGEKPVDSDAEQRDIIDCAHAPEGENHD